jgi:hypothetical protein
MNRKEQLNSYLKTSINPLIESLVLDLLKHKPEKTKIVNFYYN